MSNYYKLARQYRERADRLEFLAQQVGPLPVVVTEEDNAGNPVETQDADNEFIRGAIKSLRDHADLLLDLDRSAEFVDHEAAGALALLRGHDPKTLADAEDGWLEAQAYADDARDMY